jgi:NAD(P) transhydrogenase subunit alpha
MKGGGDSQVKEPQFNTQKNLSEIDLMHKGQYLITFIHPAARQP